MRDRLIKWFVATGVATASLWLNVISAAEVHDHRHDEEQKPPQGIVVTINPEARVSATGLRQAYRSLPCHQPIDLPVKILNLGFVTAPLVVRLLDDVPSVSSVALLGNDLTGAREEDRVLRLFLNHIGFVDITLAFSTRHGIEDLDGRSRVHLLLECDAARPRE